MFKPMALFVLTTVLGTAGLGADTPPPEQWVEAARGFPVLAEGRVMPLDTWAKVIYSRVSGKDTDPGALRWVLTLLVFPEKLDMVPSILVNDPSTLAGTGVGVSTRGRYSPRVLAPLFSRADGWVKQYAEDQNPQGRELYRLGRALVLYRDLSLTFNDADPDAQRSPVICIGLGTKNLNPAQAFVNGSLDNREKDRLGLLVYWLVQSRHGAWTDANAALQLFSGDTAALELFYNSVPWPELTVLWGILCLVSGWVFRKREKAPWSRVVSGAAWVTISVWIGIRMVISGRPPVTNLAGTFLLVSWLLLAVAFILAFRPAQRQTALLAQVAGALLPCLSTAFQAGADPFSPVQAVLNTNFWLGIHVTAIVGGYAGTFGAGLLGHAYLWTSGRKRSKGDLTGLWRNLRICLLAGLALTVAGTLLGGFWADQSWGRFWGWDPKENGALLVILWLAITLHLKPSGLTDEWGSAFAAALAVPVLLFSWLGVNLVAQGFHSYGFAPDKALVFVSLLAIDFLVIGLFTLRKVLR